MTCHVNDAGAAYDRTGRKEQTMRAHAVQTRILVSREEHCIATGSLGKVAGYMPHRLPSWFAPRLVDLSPEPFGPFPRSLALTAEGDVWLVGTEGHSGGTCR